MQNNDAGKNIYGLLCLVTQNVCN